jgi:hypothetical protein
MASIFKFPEEMDRQEFVKLIPKPARILEIGPYNNPGLSKADYPNLKYMDIFTSEQISLDQARYTHTVEIPSIDIIADPKATPTFSTDLKFDFIFSAHNIEHYPDIITHLNEVASLAASPNTKYFLAVPDRRYCFDYYQQESSFADMITAYQLGIKQHTAASYIKNKLYTTHNNIWAHWMDDHGEDPRTKDIDIKDLKKLVAEALNPNTDFADIHAWVFTNDSFMRNINTLNELGLQPWRVDLVSKPKSLTPEFYTIMSLTR